MRGRRNRVAAGLAYASPVSEVPDIERRLRRRLRALSTREFLDWRAGREYAKNAEPIVDALADLVHAGRAAAAVPLAERALTVLVAVLGHADDSAGLIGDLVRRLLDLHLDASRAARDDPTRLARWLIRFGLDDQDWFTVDVDTYAEPLGEVGVAVYRGEIERRWAAGDRSFAVRRAKERLAFVDRDVDALVALLGGELTLSRQYLHVAEAMRQLDKYDHALSWALRGLAERPDGHADKLYDFAVAEYLRRGAQEDALSLRRRQHEHRRTLASYLALRSVARAAGSWEQDRPPALALLQQERPRDHVTALLADGADDLAWEAAQSADLDPALWLRLVERRELTHPRDVVPVYRRLIEETLRTADRRNYREAVALLRRMQRAYAAASDDHTFGGYIAQLRAVHRRRPSLLEQLDRAFPRHQGADSQPPA
jgi:hypothetical protein